MRCQVWHYGHLPLPMASHGLQYRPKQVAVVRGLPMHITCHYHLTVVPTPRNRHETIRFQSKGARLSPGKITVGGRSKKPRFGFTIDPERYTHLFLSFSLSRAMGAPNSIRAWQRFIINIGATSLKSYMSICSIRVAQFSWPFMTSPHNEGYIE